MAEPADLLTENSVKKVDGKISEYVVENFKSYFARQVKKVSHQIASAEPEEAGRADGQKQPPEPRTESKAKYGYIDILFRQANIFFDSYKSLYLEDFNEKYRLLKEIVSKKLREHIDLEADIDLSELEDRVETCQRDREKFDAYKKKIREFSGYSPIDWASKTTLHGFLSTLSLIAAVEAGMIWYLLTEALGYQDALYSSFVAISFILATALFGAWMHSYTPKDLDINLKANRRISIKRVLGYLGLTLTIVVFMFGLGLLAGWRSDSTVTDISVVVDGYKSMTRIDVFITSLITAGGTILLASKIRKYFWSKYRNYSDWVKIIKNHKDAINRERLKIQSRVDDNYAEQINAINSITETFSSITNRENLYEKKLELYAKELSSIIKSMFDAYIEFNAGNRTEDAYPKPAWFDSSNWFQQGMFVFDNPYIDSQEREKINLMCEDIERDIDQYLLRFSKEIQIQYRETNQKIEQVYRRVKNAL